ncbi:MULTISPECIES: glutamine--fructose-6-phosphate transaminase (isomerizing) [Marinobacter]|jgi:glucosamine--fructose-6-phosphate aminotransferase (isomerizing)|uniref:Glutamine--fructose-6-phosphate aminotransferase [isomerizing] n=2 Tax=Marinobacter salarius TaxID=1420917 RepID=A0A1W6K4F9_9GAMM|nr:MULTISPECIES: glutamine--fructose-6-phosphate transaminase (isomerizing) [Marinobacter]ARM82326.1 glutamine--fructose-6-phosphate aminotransferase (isomerizing) [Marinobacter salarius]MBJ7300285.1 glutamine--fructose-6-phosphate transaminase (isomerizing) [Marinobacter salarius]MCC4284963.1 glutamine--fructose-6-phosphate transaminase (isomerizing) [Marinobacter salarius]MDC8454063.1 glutamine--fructose-6-phosphate transaminase (isomerizing) [Marinobacter sp. DS40M6]MDM8181220.1 glutamine--|tara:strand:+ start:2394 stop:4226 length:1833 start_codon:yes stop_codon:yes gene_type:complete
MCGIVGAVSERDVQGILLEGLRRLEYRGYDSAGMAVIDGKQAINRAREVGKVAALADAITGNGLEGAAGIAHTRWATHGEPSQINAHPHMSGDRLAIVHNGIIENYQELREELKAEGFEFTSQTDTEVVAHLIEKQFRLSNSLYEAVSTAIERLRGAFALAVIHADEPDHMVVCREGSPLVVGVGIGENFIASDQLALLPVTDRFMFLEEGDIADIRRDHIEIHDRNKQLVERAVNRFEHSQDAAEKGEYRHFMLKEIHEQPRVIRATTEGRVTNTRVLEQALGTQAGNLLEDVRHVQIIACGTSYHAGMVARYWIEDLAGVPCSVEVASEFRYRKHVIQPDTLFLCISQSGETADTLAALRQAKKAGFRAAMAICNVPGSSLVRESDLVIMTQAGPEIGVASTKAFTTQLTALLIFTLALARHNGLEESREAEIVEAIRLLPSQVDQVLALDGDIAEMSKSFMDKNHSLFLGRGAMFPVALEGALKLKEISYIHAEAYPAGELKHGPLALVDGEMPVVTVAPNNELLEKLKSNLEEVRARGGELFVFADQAADVRPQEGIHVMPLPSVHPITSPIVYTVPLQLLSYHVAVLKGTDVDQPRNLAKSVTVE